jgi:hypothetical protein
MIWIAVIGAYLTCLIGLKLKIRKCTILGAPPQQGGTAGGIRSFDGSWQLLPSAMIYAMRDGRLIISEG